MTNRWLRRTLFAAGVFLPTICARAEDGGRAPKRLDVAPGIHVFVTPPYGDVGLDGNSVAIVGRDGVLVFDANGTPAAAVRVLAEIRTLTPKPVLYLVFSHWHWDHWYGAEVYRDAFPELKIVAHEKTRAMMMGAAIEFNRPGLERDLPNYVEGLEAAVAAAEKTEPPSPRLPDLRHRLDDARFFLRAKKAVRHTFPNVTFRDRLEIDLGGRKIEVLHHEPAVTPGDAFLFLPDERILVTGDLLVNPISFALSCYPSGWIATLERLDSLDAQLIVPGHGEPLRDEDHLHATLDVFRELYRQGKAAREAGLDADAAKEKILRSPLFTPLRARITGGSTELGAAFDVQQADWFLHRVYDELAGPLGDEIAPIPPR
jgi:glyoxylase-like metal-dependent hydrolase (beta-lactamase superfamily II)